jgi:putative IMPACT (imprinted ancient) family translation regulator
MPDQPSYPRTIAAPGSHEIVVKKSRFIATLVRSASEEEARKEIDAVRKRYWDANHNCTAYRIGVGGRYQRTSDDGERRPVSLIAVDADYTDAGRLENALRATDYALGPVTHADRVTFEIRLDEPDLPGFERWLADATNGQLQPRVAGMTEVEVRVE